MEQFQLLTESQVCQALSVSRHTLFRWRKSGKLGFMKLGTKKIAYTPAHIQSLLQGFERGSGRPAKAA